MSDHHDETAPIVPDVRDGDTPQNRAEGQGLSPRSTWKERAYGVRSVAAVAVAGLIIGGGAGAAIHAATADDGGRDGRPGFGNGNRGPGGGFGGPGGQMPGQMPPGQQGGPGGGQLPQPPNGLPAQPGQVPGQTQPTTPPSDSVNPDGGDATTSGSNT